MFTKLTVAILRTSNEKNLNEFSILNFVTKMNADLVTLLNEL